MYVNPITEKIKVLDDKIKQAEIASLGLSSGKTGFCLYFYLKSRLTGNKEYEQIAGKFIEDLISNIDNLKQYDIKNGLAGVGLGIDFLINNKFVKGDSNQVLSDVDSELFKQLSYITNNAKLDFSVQLQILYYFIARLRKQKSGSEQEWLIRELIIQTINNLCEKMSFDIYDESLTFSVDYLLPQYLFVLSRSMDLCKDKINKIIRELSVFLLSKLPLLHCNRLYLLWSINELNKHTGMKDLESHCHLLYRELDMTKIINEEILSRNIYFSDGFPAIYLLICKLQDYFSEIEIEQYKLAIIDKIIQSPEWEYLIKAGEYFKMRNGLLNGYCGTSLLLHYHERGFK